MATQLAALKATAQAPAERKPKTIFDFLTDDKVKTAIAAVAGQYMTPDRFLRLAINAVKKTPRLLECDPQTVLGSFMASAALALEPNTPMGQAYLIPYGKRGKNPTSGQWEVIGYECQFQIGYRGFITLGHRSPNILTFEGEAIHAGDHFDHLKGSRAFLEYRKALKDRGELLGAYSFTKFDGGGEAATVLGIDELHKIRSKSETYQALIRGVDKAEAGYKKQKAQEKLDETPWVMWEDDMAAKSAIKKHAKQLPLEPGDPLRAAQALDAESDDGRTIDMAEMTDVDRLREVMRDGEMAPQDEGSSSNPQQLTHQEGNFIEMPTQAQQQRAEPIIVRSLDDQPTAATKAATEPTREPGQDDDDTPFDNAADSLLAAIGAANNLDALDLLADKIRALPSTEQPRLNKAYRERQASLDNVVARTAPRRADPRQSSMVME